MFAAIYAFFVIFSFHFLGESATLHNPFVKLFTFASVQQKRPIFPKNEQNIDCRSTELNSECLFFLAHSTMLSTFTHFKPQVELQLENSQEKPKIKPFFFSTDDSFF